jgi:hypothetical protein
VDDPHRTKPDPDAYPIIGVVRDAIVDAIGPSLVGLYVHGSLATGDFEPHVSDSDLIAVLRDPSDDALLRRLAQMHEDLQRAEPEWRDRIEVDYVSTQGLAECRKRATTIARIAPGDPLQLVEAGPDFLLDWYPARRDGVTLQGPPIDSLIPPIPDAEYRDQVRTYLARFRGRFDEGAGLGSQAYAILTMCRGFYSITLGERLTKREAGLRARDEFPRWADLVERALSWRERQWDPDQPDGSAHVAETRAFIEEMADRLRLDGPA